MDQAIVLPDRVCETLGRELARHLPDLFVSSHELQADFDEWYRGWHGETYTEYLRRTGQESPQRRAGLVAATGEYLRRTGRESSYQVRRKRGNAYD